MATQTSPNSRPEFGKLFGITHSPDGSLILRVPKVLKVGIGLPRGPALNVWIAPDGKWKIRQGYKKEDSTKVFTFEARAQAEGFFRENLHKSPVCTYPRKLAFFTFTRPELQSTGEELYVPDFEAIEMHGPTPAEIDIIFLDDEPFSGAYQMWSASELKCKGDGINAIRVTTLARTEEQKSLAQMAAASGEKYFPIVDGCWTCGCEYSKEPAPNKPSPCKPGGDLKFQLARNIRVGGTCFFHSTGIRSIGQLFSSLYQLKTLTGGRLAGIPLKMVLRSYKTNHNGQAATQYGVSLEFRAGDVEALKRGLIEQAMNFRRAAEIAPPPPRMLEAGTDIIDDEDDDAPPVSAAAMAAEFYPEAIEEDEPEGEPEPQNATPPVPQAPQAASAAAATEQKTEGLAEKMRRSRSSRQSAPPAAAPAAEAPAPSATTTPALEPEAAQGIQDMF